MPFAEYEQSVFSGQPIQLYQFYRKSGEVDLYWRYNTSDRDLTYAGNLYIAIPISDGGVKLSGEAAATEFQVTLPITASFCEAFRLSGTVPSDTIILHVRACHAKDITDIDTNPVVTDTRVVWVGTVDGLTQIDDIQARVTCSMIAASFRRGGLRYSWILNCPHVLYNPLTCKADKELFKTVGTVESIAGNVVTSSDFEAQPDGWFDGGYIEYVLESGATERRWILTHVGAVLTILGIAAGLEVGDSVNAYAGCAHNVSACVEKFDNYLNYGGFEDLPGRNPFDGNPVF